MKIYRVVDEEKKLIAVVKINDSGFHVEWAGAGKDVNSFDALLESLPEGKSWKIQRAETMNESTNVRRYKQEPIAGQSLGRCEYLVWDLLWMHFGELVELKTLEAAISLFSSAKKSSLRSFVASLRKKLSRWDWTLLAIKRKGTFCEKSKYKKFTCFFPVFRV